MIKTIKYADNVTLTVEITEQMVKDFKRCQEMAEKVNVMEWTVTAAQTTLISWTDSVFVMCRKSEKNWKGESSMNNKTCATCINNDNGLCDRKGILIHEDDTCDQHKEDWREKMLEKFDRRE